MISLHLSSTLFPYTTLFRSCLINKRRLIDRINDDSFFSVGIAQDIAVGRGETKSQNTNFDAQDRKSTRLNSSHLGISYAVFCLKKKNKKEIDFDQTANNTKD